MILKFILLIYYPDGVAVDSPLGPLLADVFIASIEERLEKKINKLPLYRR